MSTKPFTTFLQNKLKLYTTVNICEVSNFRAIA